MRLITLLVTVAALAVAAPAIADRGGVPHGGNGGGGGHDATATPTPTPSSSTLTSSSTTSNNGPKSGGGSQKSSDPSISIATVDGVAMAASTRPEPAHGDTVTFNTTYGPLGGAHPMVELSCYQDVDGDGLDMSLSSPDLVELELDQPDTTFTMSGPGWTAGNATCHAHLLSYGWKGGQESVQLLASTYDWTAAW
jgi:hypothetical protein